MYEIIKKINEDTFLALRENTVFVLKRTDPSQAELYDRLSAVKHKSVVGFYGSTVVENRHYCVFEYVSGETLEEYIDRNGVLSDGETRKIVSLLCDGLAKIHEAGIIHRDIKPGNVIITKSGEPVIIDFGISRLVKENVSSDTYILGTHGYAAPEQFGFHQSTDRTDIYAMGSLINYMKTGCLPSEKMTDGVFEKIIRRCTEIDEAKRYASAYELKAALMRKKLNINIDLIYSIPGFSRDNSFKTAISVIYYIVCALFILFGTDNRGVKGFIGDRLPMFFIFVMPYFIMWDIGSFTSKLGVSKERNKAANLILRTAVSFISVVIGFLLIAFFSTDK